MTATARAALLLGLALTSSGCGEDLVVRVTTRIWPQGGLGRRVEVIGREEDGTKPKQENWLAVHGGVQLARRDAWSHVEETPGRIAAEGFFGRAEDLPPTLAHRTGGTVVVDHAQVSLRTDDLVVLRRWLYRESLGDPYGPAETSAALDALLSLAVEVLRGELRDELGESIATASAEAFLREEGRKLLEELVSALRRERAGPAAPAGSRRPWMDVLARHGVPVDPSSEDPFSGAQAALLSGWLRTRVAEALSTPESPVSADDLAFLPGGDADDEAGAGAGAARIWGGDEELARRIEPILPALSGYYGDGWGPRFRFEARLTLAGRLLRTNGTPDRDSSVWIFRDEDLTQGERVLEAESVELNDDSLKSLGARRDFDAGSLAHLTDLLTSRDQDGALRKLLASAVERGRLAVLRDDAKVPDDIRPLAHELADLLDPAVEIEPPLP